MAVQKSVALRLKRICSSDEKYAEKAKDYKAFLVTRNHRPEDVITNFEKIENVDRVNARRKQTRAEAQKKHRFFTQYNTRAPNILEIIKKHEHFIRDNEFLNKIFPQDSFQVVNRRSKNLKELILRADPYSTKTTQSGHYEKCGRCDLCKNFVSGSAQIECFATGRIFNLRKNINCETRNVVYVAYCTKCSQQGVGSTVKWIPMLSNYKGHIKKKLKTCRIVRHFAETCFDNDEQVRMNPGKYITFHIIDTLDNVDGLSTEQIDNLLHEKEKMWIRNFVTAHKGLNSHHDLNRVKRCEREKLD